MKKPTIADQIWQLNNEYNQRMQEINDREPKIAAQYPSIDPRADREGYRERKRRIGAEIQRLHDENTAWYRAEREKLTGISYEQEMANVDAHFAASKVED